MVSRDNAGVVMRIASGVESNSLSAPIAWILPP